METVGCSARRCAIVCQWKEDAGDGTQAVSSRTLQDCTSRPLCTDATGTGNERTYGYGEQMLTALQAENARSLKLLHDYLNQSRGDYAGPSAPFRFVFFKKQESRTDEHTKGEAIGDGGCILTSVFVSSKMNRRVRRFRWCCRRQ